MANGKYQIYFDESGEVIEAYYEGNMANQLISSEHS